MTGNDTERDALARFAGLLDAYGAEPRRWPADRRAWAEALLARSPDAVALRATAARLDGLIDAAGVEPAPAHLVGRVLASAPQSSLAEAQRQSSRPRGWLAGLMKPALGVAFAALLGIVLGGVVSPFAPPNGETAEADTVSLDLGGIAESDL
jgi:hypothetical protein